MPVVLPFIRRSNQEGGQNYGVIQQPHRMLYKGVVGGVIGTDCDDSKLSVSDAFFIHHLRSITRGQLLVIP